MDFMNRMFLSPKGDSASAAWHAPSRDMNRDVTVIDISPKGAALIAGSRCPERDRSIRSQSATDRKHAKPKQSEDKTNRASFSKSSLSR